MKAPTPTKTADGWRIQLRLGGQSIVIKEITYNIFRKKGKKVDIAQATK